MMHPKLMAKKDFGRLTRLIFDTSKVERDGKSADNVLFTKKNDLFILDKSHRKKGKIVFSKDPLSLKRLLLMGTMPSSYVKMMETYRKFYFELDQDVQL